MLDTLFESPGRWWVPGKEERQVSGILRIRTSGRLEIQLFETLDDDATDFSQRSLRPVLLGELHSSPLSGGSRLTHFDFFATRRFLRSNGTSAETLVANRSYVGDDHLADRLHAHARFALGIRGLNRWLPFSPVTRTAKGGVVRIEVGKPAALDVVLDGGALSFRKSAEVSSSEEETTIRTSARVIVDVRPGRPADDFVREWATPLRFFLSLALGKMTQVDSLDIILGLGDERPWPDEVHDLEVWSRAQVERRGPSVDPFDTLIAPPRDQAELQDLLVAWRALYGRLRRPMDRIFALWEAPPTFVEMRLAAVVDAFDLLVRSLEPIPDPIRLLERLGPAVTGGLPPAKELLTELHRYSRAIQAGEEIDAKGVFAIAEVFQWLMRLALLEELGLDTERASRAPAFRHALSRIGSG